MNAEQIFLGPNAIGVDRSYVQEVIKEEITPEKILEVLKPWLKCKKRLLKSQF